MFEWLEHVNSYFTHSKNKNSMNNKTESMNEEQCSKHPLIRQIAELTDELMGMGSQLLIIYPSESGWVQSHADTDAVKMPSLFKTLAILFRLKPSPIICRIRVMLSSANIFARSLIAFTPACRPLLAASGERFCVFPNRTPLAFAAASASLVLLLIPFRSSWSTRAIITTVKSLAAGMSTAMN